MKRNILLVSVLSVLAVTSGTLAGIVWDDGLTHLIDDPSYQTLIKVDEGVVNDPGTHVEMVDNGIVSNLWLYNNASFTASGGIASMVMAYDNSKVLLEGGEVNFIFAYGNSEVNVKGGEPSFLSPNENGIIYMHGSDFSVDVYGTITNLSYGDRISDYTDDQGLLRGTLADGTVLGGLVTTGGAAVNGIPFEIYREYSWQTGDIIIVPEPCSLMLLALGGLVLRRRSE